MKLTNEQESYYGAYEHVDHKRTFSGSEPSQPDKSRSIGLAGMTVLIIFPCLLLFFCQAVSSR